MIEPERNSATDFVEEKENTPTNEGTSPDPTEILSQFALNEQIVRDIAEVAIIRNHSHEKVKIKYQQTVEVTEVSSVESVPIDRYESSLGNYRVPYSERYEHYPTGVQKAIENREVVDLQYLENEKEQSVTFEQKTGCDPEPCYRCNGSGRIECSTCRGNGQKTCRQCRGDNIEKCPNPTCQSGHTYCRGCDGNGKVKSEKSGKRVCPTCQGNPKSVCGTCNGENEIPCRNGNCKDGKVRCANCDIKNEVECTTCEGHGKVVEITVGDVNYTISQTLEYDGESSVPENMIQVHTENNKLYMENIVDNNVIERHPSPETNVLQEQTTYLTSGYDQIEYSYKGSSHVVHHLDGDFSYDSTPVKRNRAIVYSILLFSTISATLFLIGSEDLLALVGGMF